MQLAQCGHRVAWFYNKNITDASNGWVRIDDVQHPWGALSVITGDAKAFGTVYIGSRGINYGTSSN